MGKVFFLEEEGTDDFTLHQYSRQLLTREFQGIKGDGRSQNQRRAIVLSPTVLQPDW